MQVLVNLIYDEEFKGYVADVPQLPGCMSQGKTIESAMRNVREAIELYLETQPLKKALSLKPALTTVIEI
ncbi:MAG TPA: type II toxin-antitoxin system HicB family antitoxin [Candidatus Brocadiia bacterium]|nr:type II toxin-antitoxin system HicB family antitoxin [Candidatus Brocadiia bacterium]